MKINFISLHPYETFFHNGQKRQGAFLQVEDEQGKEGWGEIAPLPHWSDETLTEALNQINEKKPEILAIDWTASHCLQELKKLYLFPSVLFGLESALLAILKPIGAVSLPVSALLMGTPKEIRQQADKRSQEGYTFAKLKVSQLSFKEAKEVIYRLLDKFALHIDVNRAWKTSESLKFFKQFPLDTFNYIEEPFQNPYDLALFPHPLAVDESFPHNLTLKNLESLPTLKALIYKPTIQGGLLKCLPLHKWAKQRGLQLVLSSSFESELGLAHIAGLAHRLSLNAPLGIGTFHYCKESFCFPPLQFARSFIHVPAFLKPQF